MNHTNDNETPANVAIIEMEPVWLLGAKAMCSFLAGLVTAGGGLAAAVTIGAHQGLRDRKQFILIGALCLADGVTGVGYLWHGALECYRLLFAPAAQMASFSLAWCIFQPSNFCWALAQLPAATTLCVLSIDRLVAVSIPLWHYGAGVSYARGLMSAAWTVGVLDLLVCMQFALSHSHTAVTQCQYGTVSYKTQIAIRQLGIILSVTLSVLLVLCIPCRVRRLFANKVAAASTDGPGNPSKTQSAGVEKNQKKHHVRLEREMVRSVSMTTVFSVAFYILPLALSIQVHYSGRFLLFEMNPQYSGVIPFLLFVNPILNVATFFYNCAELRKGFLALTHWKTLPANCAMW